MDDLKQRLWDAIAFTAKPIHELEHRLAVDSLARIERLEAALREIDNEATGRLETWRKEEGIAVPVTVVIIKGIARRALDEEDTDAS